MIITDKVENEAILSSTMQVGEFRIKNSSKAFAILSSGLYANKIRAIIRELSCNAVDAHIAAGKPNEPIECHLPNALEPWFAIRDRGIGLSHDAVVNIYTTYFESTKTDSNDYIGALGLGSKSPFSYTENFTVTAVKDGKKGIYSAFINNQGLPSIVLLQSEDTTESNGVEVKFAVNQDFDKFRQEATYVYTWFKVKPVIKGANIAIPTLDYVQKDFAPGIHLKSRSGRGQQSCVALMGNISYPINVPNKEQLGHLASYLGYEFHIEFNIGELDIQASREGLSYIKDTIDAIKAKLEIIHKSINKNVEEQLKDVSGFWETAAKYRELNSIDLYRPAIKHRLQTLNHPLQVQNSYGNHLFTDITLKGDVLEKYNIAVSAFSAGWSSTSWRNVKTERNTYNHATRNYETHHQFGFSDESVFIKNDLKIGASARAKHHLGNGRGRSNKTYYVISVADKNKPNMIDEFMKKELYNPPKEQVMLASSFDAPPKKVREKKTKIVKMVMSNNRRNNEWVWRNVDESTITDWKDVVYVKISGLVVYKGKDTFPIHDHFAKALQIKAFTLVGVDEEGCKTLAARGAKEYFAFTDDLVSKYFNSPNYQMACYYNAINSYGYQHLEQFSKVLAQLDFKEIDNKAGKLYTVGKLMVDAINNGSKAYHIVESMVAGATEAKFKADTALVRQECEKLFSTYQMLSLVDYIKLYHNRSSTSDGKKIVISYINQIGV